MARMMTHEVQCIAADREFCDDLIDPIMLLVVMLDCSTPCPSSSLYLEYLFGTLLSLFVVDLGRPRRSGASCQHLQ
jgi:hypothetical protein